MRGAMASWTMVWGMSLVAAAWGQQATIEGALTIGEKHYKLTKAAAYPVRSGDEARFIVLASDRNLPLAKIKQALAEDGNDDDVFVTQPHVKLIFKPTGEIESCSGWADNSSFSTGGEGLSGALRLSDDRAAGEAALAADEESAFQRSFQVKFDAPLGLDVAQAKPTRSGPVKPQVSGKFLGNGKAAKLAFVSARPGEPFNDEPSIELVFTEKDHSKDKKPGFKAGFGDYGSALVISCHEDGGIFGCQIVHKALEKQGFTSIGRMRLAEFELGEGFVAGQLTSDGEDEFFDDKWDVDLKFETPLSAGAQPAAEKKPAPAKAKSESPKAAKPKAEKPKPMAAKLKVRELALPKTATDFEYKALVEQFLFKSPAKVQALAADVTKQLAAQGWTKDGSDLITPSSAILRRQRGEASLTIMLKPEGSGSQATVFAEGLDWEE